MAAANALVAEVLNNATADRLAALDKVLSATLNRVKRASVRANATPAKVGKPKAPAKPKTPAKPKAPAKAATPVGMR